MECEESLMQNPFPRFDGFTYAPAIPREEGVTRRDPIPVIRVDETFYVWYSRTTETAHGYTASVWYATSSDGLSWIERGEALPKGAEGAFDEHAVFTPTILRSGGRFYLFYTAVPEPFTNDQGGPGGTRTAIGVATSECPQGPWERFAGNPVLCPDNDPRRFDSMRVDDTCLLVRDERYWMFYKGRQANRTPGQTKMGLAVADSPTGPYEKHAANPVLDSGHEVCVWPHGAGVGCIVAPTGPQGSSLQYSPDGLHFQKVRDCQPPKAPGPHREDDFRDGPGPGVRWGISMEHDPRWPYLVRFECDLSAPGS
jgi:hypothetical protein